MGPLRSDETPNISRDKHRGLSARSCAALEWPAMSHLDHKAAAPASVGCFVLTISDTRTEATDVSGRAIASLLCDAGHVVVGRAIVTDDVHLVRGAIERQLANPDVRIIITTGGTGV